MKFVKDNAEKGLLIPAAALKSSGFDTKRPVEYHAQNDAIIVLKKQMTAMDLITAANELYILAAKLVAGLKEQIGPCEECREDCRFDEENLGYAFVPEHLRAQAGIPADAKFDVTPLKESNSILLTPAAHRYDLQDVPSVFLEVLAGSGVCLESLESLLMEESIVYGGD